MDCFVVCWRMEQMMDTGRRWEQKTLSNQKSLRQICLFLQFINIFWEPSFSLSNVLCCNRHTHKWEQLNSTLKYKSLPGLKDAKFSALKTHSQNTTGKLQVRKEQVLLKNPDFSKLISLDSNPDSLASWA